MSRVFFQNGLSDSFFGSEGVLEICIEVSKLCQRSARRPDDTSAVIHVRNLRTTLIILY